MRLPARLISAALVLLATSAAASEQAPDRLAKERADCEKRMGAARAKNPEQFNLLLYKAALHGLQGTTTREICIHYHPGTQPDNSTPAKN